MDKVLVLDVFSLAERVEACAQEFYAKVANQTENSTLKKVFSWIAAQEVGHEKVYAELRNRVINELAQDSREVFSQPKQPRSVEYVLERFHPELNRRLRSFLDAEREVVNSAAVIEDPLQAIDFAILFEEVTLELYRELQKHVCLASKPRVEVIINEEKRHLREFIALKAKILAARNP